jgi:hypothetical protein
MYLYCPESVSASTIEKFGEMWITGDVKVVLKGRYGEVLADSKRLIMETGSMDGVMDMDMELNMTMPRTYEN